MMNEREKKIAEVLEKYHYDREILERGYINAVCDVKNDPTAIEATYENRKTRLAQKAFETLAEIGDDNSVREGLQETRMAFYVAHADGKLVNTAEVKTIAVSHDLDAEKPYFAIMENGKLAITDEKGKFAYHTDDDIRIFIRGEIQV